MATKLGTLLREWLSGEQGTISFARPLLLAEVIYIWMFGPLLSGELLTVHSGLLLALIGWTGGPRMMQYLGPQIGKVTQAVASAVKAKAERKQLGDNRFKDDERD